MERINVDVKLFVQTLIYNICDFNSNSTDTIKSQI